MCYIWCLCVKSQECTHVCRCACVCEHVRDGGWGCLPVSFSTFYFETKSPVEPGVHHFSKTSKAQQASCLPLPALWLQTHTAALGLTWVLRILTWLLMLSQQVLLPTESSPQIFLFILTRVDLMGHCASCLGISGDWGETFWQWMGNGRAFGCLCSHYVGDETTSQDLGTGLWLSQFKAHETQYPPYPELNWETDYIMPPIV